MTRPQCVVHQVALIKHCLWAPHINTNTHDAKELAHSWRWNKTVPSAENRTAEGEEACCAYWYSLQLILMDTDTLHIQGSHRGKKGRKPKTERVRATRSTSLILDRKLTQCLLLLLSCASHSCLCGQTLLSLLRSQRV